MNIKIKCKEWEESKDSIWLDIDGEADNIPFDDSVTLFYNDYDEGIWYRTTEEKVVKSIKETLDYVFQKYKNEIEKAKNNKIDNYFKIIDEERKVELVFTDDKEIIISWCPAIYEMGIIGDDKTQYKNTKDSSMWIYLTFYVD